MDEGNTFIRGTARLDVYIHCHMGMHKALQFYGIY